MGFGQKKILSFFIVCALVKVNASAIISPPGFIENKGQVLNQFYEPNNEVLFLYSGKGLNIQLRKTGYSYELFSANNFPGQPENKTNLNVKGLLNTTVHSNRVDVDFLSMTEDFKVEVGDKSEDYLNYFIGAKEVTHVHSYQRVLYKNVFKNTDIEFILIGNGNSEFKYNIILHPGADINSIKFLVQGASSLFKTTDGNLNIGLQLGTIHEKIPLSYYLDSPDKNKKVNFDIDNKIVSFSTDYDPSRTLVIDPSQYLMWGTYYGNSAIDYCNALGIDAQDNVYMAGHTMSIANIATSGTHQSVLNGDFDVFLVKFDASGNRMWGTYFGGSSVDVAYGLSVHPDGTVYLCGDTFSTGNIATPGAHQTSYGGGIDDGILVKFDAMGQRIWATYFGGTEHDIAQAVTIDPLGNVIMTGHSESANGIATPGSYNPVYTLAFDVFVAKFNSSGVLQWSTYYGDTGVDEAYGIACDASNAIFVTGTTQSIAGISTANAHQVSPAGLQDVFISKFSSSGNLIWGTYYGGKGNDFGTAIEASGSGAIYICGTTASSTGISSPGAYHPGLASSDDAFLACFSSGGARQWGSYFGGNDVDYITDMILDSNGDVFFSGSSMSTDSISTSGAYQVTNAGVNTYDAYFTKFNSSGQRTFGSYFGGASNDFGKGIVLDKTGQVYLAGETTSSVGISTGGSHMPGPGGKMDSFLAKFCLSATVNCILSVPENEKKDHIKIYPNPSSGFITVEVESVTPGNFIEVYSSHGQLLLVNEIKERVSKIETETLSHGIYFLRLMTESGIRTKKFIKER